jgi:hypothetical protein
MSPGQRAAVAALDVCVVVGTALLVSLPAGFTPWIAIACCALLYYAGSTVWAGRTPAAAWLRYRAAAAAHREVSRRHEVRTQPVALAMTIAGDDGRDETASGERRSGTDRRRRPVRHEPPRQSEGVGRLVGTPSTPSVH